MIKKKKHNEKENAIPDCVVFMTAYNVDSLKHKWNIPKKRKDFKELLSKYHIQNILIKNTLITQKGKCELHIEYDEYEQKTEFKFDVLNKEDKIEDYQEEIQRVGWGMSLRHSVKLLLNSSECTIDTCINMESFLIQLNTSVVQVEPIIFYFNEMLFICFELIDYNTGIPLSKNDIYGYSNNYNLVHVTGVRFFEEDTFRDENKKIADIIFDNIMSLFKESINDKYEVGKISYVHNILVISNSISNITRYFEEVLGETGVKLNLKNICSKNIFKYYSQEYLGVAVIKQNNDYRQALWDTQVLEILKMYILLNQIVSYEVKNDLKDTYYKKIYIDFLMFESNMPIITLNAIENIQNTMAFKRYAEAIDFKIAFMKMLSEKRKEKNAILLNILLYVLAFIGSVSSLQVLQQELGCPFKISLIIVTSIFVILGIIWIWKEHKNNDRIS